MARTEKQAPELHVKFIAAWRSVTSRSHPRISPDMKYNHNLLIFLPVYLSFPIC